MALDSGAFLYLQMPQASFRFYRELNDFLPRAQRQCTLTLTFGVPGSVKDAIESLGVPHTEVDLILANGESVDFNYRVQDGDRISVYPQFERLDITPLTRLRSQPLREPRFVLDCHLGRLARYLRMLGFDTLYRPDYHDDTLLQISLKQKRILLTRDRGLLKRSELEHGYYVRATKPRQQLAEVVQRLQLERRALPFSRCIACNGTLAAVTKRAVEPLLPENTRHYFHEFFQCRDCRRVYWKGSHFERMQLLVQEVLQHTGDSSEPPA
ncbi:MULTISPECIES: Mut7-C RNAse domain-containing protein [unclassified Microbulbifer]|uniref:Mut7-C RNAse domain-containing protein n=1 Tax=unclassified Microbulbifer TaxID=2619833 RepID=UPI0027E493E6|nr:MULTISPECIES: Mut7-C RNAse domain-containing protein [unclassified Microbulbifer]